MKRFEVALLAACAVLAVCTIPSMAAVRGQYVEVRSADVYTGPCFANSEVGLAGRHAILAWKISQGAWQGTKLNGLNVIAVVDAKDNLGDPYHNPYPAKSVLIIDQRATAAQQRALVAFARTAGGPLVEHVVRVERAPVNIEFGAGMNHGSVTLVAGNLARIQTRSLCAGDDICGNEIRFYPPLTKVSDAMPAYTIDASYQGSGLGGVWTRRDDRSAYVGNFNL